MTAGRGRSALMLIAALACSGAPGAAVAQADDSDAAGVGCVAMAAVPWTVPGGKTYRIGAVSAGSTCAAANVTLTIRGAAGAALLTFTSAAADLPLLFAEATTPAAMIAALRRWIEQPAGRTTRNLPVWDAGADEPKAGEFVFHPEPLITRAHYAELRKWGQPEICFLQGAESEACYALDTKADTLTLIGTQTLPG